MEYIKRDCGVHSGPKRDSGCNKCAKCHKPESKGYRNGIQAGSGGYMAAVAGDIVERKPWWPK